MLFSVWATTDFFVFVLLLSFLFPPVNSVCPTTLTGWKVSRNCSREPLMESVSMMSMGTSEPTNLARALHPAILYMCSRGQPRTNQIRVWCLLVYYYNAFLYAQTSHFLLLNLPKTSKQAKPKEKQKKQTVLIMAFTKEQCIMWPVSSLLHVVVASSFTQNYLLYLCFYNVFLWRLGANVFYRVFFPLVLTWAI